MKYKSPPMKWNTGQMQFEPDLSAIKKKPKKEQELEKQKESHNSKLWMIILAIIILIAFIVLISFVFLKP